MESVVFDYALVSFTNFFELVVTTPGFFEVYFETLSFHYCGIYSMVVDVGNMETSFFILQFQILSGRRSKQRQSEFNLAVTLVSIVFMHIVCNALRVFLGILVVALVGKYQPTEDF